MNTDWNMEEYGYESFSTKLPEARLPDVYTVVHGPIVPIHSLCNEGL